MTKELVTQGKNELLTALTKRGMTPDMVAEKIMEMLDWYETKTDKNGNAYEIKDGNLRLKAIELWLKLQQSKLPTNNNHLHVTENVLDKLLGQDKKAKGKKS